MKETKIMNGRAVALLLCAVLSLNACAAEPRKLSATKGATLTQEYVWYDGDREQKVWLDPQLVAEFDPTPQGESMVKRASPSASMMSGQQRQSNIRLWQMNNSGGTAVRSLKASHPQGKYSAVLHDGQSSGGRMRALPGNIIVYLNPQWDEPTVHAWLTAKNLKVVKKLEIGQNIYVLQTGPGLEALDTANALYRSGEVKAAFPDWWQEVVTR